MTVEGVDRASDICNIVLILNFVQISFRLFDQAPHLPRIGRIYFRGNSINSDAIF